MAMNSIPSLKDAIYKIQTYLLDGISKENQLLAAANLISRSDYDDVVTERTITNLCGYPLCNKYLPCDRPKKGRYRISLKEHSVYDLKETWLYCSPECVINSQAFSKLLKPERCEVSDPGKIAEILNLFSSPSIEESNAGGAEKNEKISLAFSGLTIHEKEDVSVGDIQSMDFVGPYNAIEGYVPRQDQVPPVQRKGNILLIFWMANEKRGFGFKNFVAEFGMVSEKSGFGFIMMAHWEATLVWNEPKFSSFKCLFIKDKS